MDVQARQTENQRMILGTPKGTFDRRRFLKATSAAVAGAGLAGLVAPSARSASAAKPVGPAAARMISFSGYDWSVKTSSGKVGPGPNYFSDSAQNVWLDNQGRLHLKITRLKGRWYCAEVVSVASFGHGTYRFYLDSAVDNLDPNVVLGLFTWNDDPAYNHREIDVEFARWGDAKNQIGQYVVQPYDNPDNIRRFTQPAGVPQSSHSFEWRSNQVAFASLKGHTVPPASSSDVIYQWNFGGTVPPAGGENARMNLWLFRGSAPRNKAEVEIVVKKFEFLSS